MNLYIQIFYDFNAFDFEENIIGIWHQNILSIACLITLFFNVKTTRIIFLDLE